MTRRPPPASVALLFVALAALLLTGVAADAEEGSSTLAVTVDQVGWWTSRVGATATDDGGFEVGSRPDGEPQSIAAVQVTITAGSVDHFAIQLVEESAVAEFGSIDVCTTAPGWSAENPGVLDDAPTPDCSASIGLTRATDTMVWLGDITPLVRDGGTVSLVFVPVYAPPTGVGPGTVIRIDEIRTEATGSTVTPTSSTTTTALEAAPSPPPTIGSTDQPFVAPPVSIAPPATEPGPLSGALAESNLAVTSPGATEISPTGPDDEFFTLGEAEQFPGDPRPWGRLVLLVPLSAAIGYAAVRARRLLLVRGVAASI